MTICPLGHEKDEGQPCSDCANKWQRYVATEVAQALDALEFAHGAIVDAIGLEDGLDGAAGEAVLQMIRDALVANGRDKPCLPDDTKVGNLRDLRDELQHRLNLLNYELVAAQASLPTPDAEKK